ncbi:hypothetical protein HDU92_002872 [Lobulomyces angularis]|nr:hypothetical protein HDU92_002872 [Lobulomyces angularis]
MTRIMEKIKKYGFKRLFTIKKSQFRYTVLILLCVSLNQLLLILNQMYQYKIEDSNVQNQVNDTILLRYSYYQSTITCILSIINYVLHFLGINFMLFMASDRFLKMHTITHNSKMSFVIRGIRMVYLCGCIVTLTYMIFDFLTANVAGYPYERLRVQFNIFSVSFFLIVVSATLTDFFFNVMMIRTVIYSMNGAVIEKVQKRAKLKLISLSIASTALEIIAASLFVKAGQIVEIKFIATAPTFAHLIISTMLLEALKNINQIIREVIKKRPLQNSTAISPVKNKSFTSSYLTGESECSKIPDVF